MKILVVGRTYPTKKSGSIGLFEYEQARALSEKNEVTFLFLDNQSLRKHRSFKNLELKDCKLKIFGKYLPIGGTPNILFDRIKFILFKKKFFEIYGNSDFPDLVHFHFPLLTSNSYIIKFLVDKNIKIVCTEHWTKVQQMSITNRQIDFYQELAEFSRLISVSDVLRKSMEKIIEKPVVIKVIPNFIDEDTFFIDDNQKKTNEYISIGRLTKIKNNCLLVNSLIVNNINTSCSVLLKIIGNGPDKLNVDSIVKNHNISNIIFSDFINKDKLNIELNKSKAYVSTSLVETFGVPVVEAWYSGVPVIIPSSHPLASFVTKDNGVLFDLKNSKDLAEKLVSVQNKPWNKQLIRKNAIDSFSKQNVLKNIEEVYRG